jgi:hypothetical protein
MPRTNAIIVADGTSCRHQIHDGTARHVSAVLAQSMQAASAKSA